MGTVTGVTTNPSIISKENKSLNQCIEEIAKLSAELTILVEAVGETSDELVSHPPELVRFTPEINEKTNVIVASIRNPHSVSYLFETECDIVTMPVNILE
jgi:transaldolase